MPRNQCSLHCGTDLVVWVELLRHAAHTQQQAKQECKRKHVSRCFDWCSACVVCNFHRTPMVATPCDTWKAAQTRKLSMTAQHAAVGTCGRLIVNNVDDMRPLLPDHISTTGRQHTENLQAWLLLQTLLACAAVGCRHIRDCRLQEIV